MASDLDAARFRACGHSDSQHALLVRFGSVRRSEHPFHFCGKKFVLDQYGDHVLTCKKHTGAIAGHDHVMNVTAQLARNSGLKVRVNRKVDTTAADNNKQGDVQAMDFGIPGYEHLVWDVSLVSDRIGSSWQHGLNGKMKLGDYLNARATIKNRRYKHDYAAKNIAFAPAILYLFCRQDSS